VIKFCTQCSAQVVVEVPAGDNLPRAVCKCCGHIHYENPRLVVGCVCEWEGAILLCRRAIEPRYGLWTLPAGFMENGETTAAAAARETLEEACADVAIDEPYAMVNVAHINQVHLFYRGRLKEPVYSAGPESLEVALVREAHIPWNELAFRSVTLCLRRYFDDLRAGTFGFHTADLEPLECS
jgi:ADP-ribose pyrophosphatase YjhB (NUDIX family)